MTGHPDPPRGDAQRLLGIAVLLAMLHRAGQPFVPGGYVVAIVLADNPPSRECSAEAQQVKPPSGSLPWNRAYAAALLLLRTVPRLLRLMDDFIAAVSDGLPSPGAPGASSPVSFSLAT